MSDWHKLDPGHILSEGRADVLAWLPQLPSGPEHQAGSLTDSEAQRLERIADEFDLPAETLISVTDSSWDSRSDEFKEALEEFFEQVPTYDVERVALSLGGSWSEKAGGKALSGLVAYVRHLQALRGLYHTKTHKLKLDTPEDRDFLSANHPVEYELLEEMAAHINGSDEKSDVWWGLELYTGPFEKSRSPEEASEALHTLARSGVVRLIFPKRPDKTKVRPGFAIDRVDLGVRLTDFGIRLGRHLGLQGIPYPVEDVEGFIDKAIREARASYWYEQLLEEIRTDNPSDPAPGYCPVEALENRIIDLAERDNPGIWTNDKAITKARDVLKPVDWDHYRMDPLPTNDPNQLTFKLAMIKAGLWDDLEDDFADLLDLDMPTDYSEPDLPEKMVRIGDQEVSVSEVQQMITRIHRENLFTVDSNKKSEAGYILGRQQRDRSILYVSEKPGENGPGWGWGGTNSLKARQFDKASAVRFWFDMIDAGAIPEVFPRLADEDLVRDRDTNAQASPVFQYKGEFDTDGVSSQILELFSETNVAVPAEAVPNHFICENDVVVAASMAVVTDKRYKVWATYLPNRVNQLPRLMTAIRDHHLKLAAMMKGQRLEVVAGCNPMKRILDQLGLEPLYPEEHAMVYGPPRADETSMPDEEPLVDPDLLEDSVDLDGVEVLITRDSDGDGDSPYYVLEADEPIDLDDLRDALADLLSVDVDQIQFGTDYNEFVLRVAG